ncbi:MAG TPA: 1,2-phenylacetyl-CoA epoxidase subunit PaaD [Actinomycetota bacterium]|nr:1,2-phenylacetyl-CoA epoxidase subunit PaaD [Actinomycetota bacterium]
MKLRTRPPVPENPRKLTLARVYELLREVSDPEIPAISIVDLGLIEDVEVGDDNVVHVTCLPTFVGCPALEAIREDIEDAIRAAGAMAEVKFVFDPPWTTDRISEEGLAKLEDYGLAPPSRSRPGAVSLTLMSPGSCPFCGSRDTVLESPFGPTACRATCYCRSCRNPYEKFKEI